jgi:hypothetical protein
MNWQRTALVLVLVGAATAIGGFIWRNQLQGEADQCRVGNIVRNMEGYGDATCPTTTAGVVIAIVGAVIAVVGVAMLAGAASTTSDEVVEGNPW